MMEPGLSLSRPCFSWANWLSCGSALEFAQLVSLQQGSPRPSSKPPPWLLWVSFETSRGLAHQVIPWCSDVFHRLPENTSSYWWPRMVFNSEFGTSKVAITSLHIKSPKGSQAWLVLFTSIFREEEGTVVDPWLLETHPCDLAALEIVDYAEVTQPHLEWGFGSLFECSDPIGQDFIQIFIFFSLL